MSFPTPPPRPRLVAVPTIAALCVAIHGLWFLAGIRPSFGGFMLIHFSTSWRHLSEGLYWTPLTSVFSHAATFHLLINLLVLVSFGRVLELMWGPWRFAGFFVGGGIFSSLVHCTLGRVGWPDVPALGASGALAAAVMVFALLFPRQKLLLFFFVPIRAWLAVVLLFGFDLWGLIGQYDGHGLMIGNHVQIGHGAHLGGALFGAIWFFAVVRPAVRRRAPTPLRYRVEIDPAGRIRLELLERPPGPGTIDGN